MRQLFLLVASAMGLAFSLSEMPFSSYQSRMVLPDEVALPAVVRSWEQTEITATVTLKNSCESVIGTDQEWRGDQLVLSVHVSEATGQVCHESTTSVPVVFTIINSESAFDKYTNIYVYFEEADSTLKYYGAIGIGRAHTIAGL